MNLFNKAKVRASHSIFSKCHKCGCEFTPDQRNVKRGWGLFCGKSCAAKWANEKQTKQTKRDYALAQLGIKDE